MSDTKRHSLQTSVHSSSHCAVLGKYASAAGVAQHFEHASAQYWIEPVQHISTVLGSCELEDIAYRCGTGTERLMDIANRNGDRPANGRVHKD